MDPTLKNTVTIASIKGNSYPIISLISRLAPSDPKGLPEVKPPHMMDKGGIIIRKNGPHWLCNDCKTAWCKTRKELYLLDEFNEIIPKTVT